MKECSSARLGMTRSGPRQLTLLSGMGQGWGQASSMEVGDYDDVIKHRV
jgi:hypothetical protein